MDYENPKKLQADLKRATTKAPPPPTKMTTRNRGPPSEKKIDEEIEEEIDEEIDEVPPMKKTKGKPKKPQEPKEYVFESLEANVLDEPFAMFHINKRPDKAPKMTFPAIEMAAIYHAKKYVESFIADLTAVENEQYEEMNEL
jgi:uncharacterized protein (DUF4415 family)